ncbi:MAG TPA: insulinase family protein, partial [Nevskiaceae bacterium]|nr:insulinase family protein [Nevskiaceae bacterium]
FGQSSFAIRAPVETAHTADALREITREVREILTTRKPSAAEVSEAKDSIVKSLPSSIETSGQLDSQMSYILTYGLPDDYYDTYVDKLRALDAAQLDAAARKLVTPSALTWVIVGDLSRIERPIRALKLGEVRVIDAEGKPVP